MIRSSRFLKLNSIFLAFAGTLVFATPFTVAKPASQTLVAPVEFQSSVVSVVAGTPSMSFGQIGAPSASIQDFSLDPVTGTVTPQGPGNGSVVAGTSNTGSVTFNAPTAPFGFGAVFESNLSGPTPAICSGGTAGTVGIKKITFDEPFIAFTNQPFSTTIHTGGTVEVSSDAEGFFTCLYDVSVSVQQLG
jgi:hypothetical protein